MSEIVIKVEHLSKYYKLGVINNGTLFKDIQTWLALKRGKVDPHSRIGENKYDPTKEGFWALSNLDFEIKQGDRVGIIGKNGAGKSTLLKILSRITAPTEGLIKIKGRVASLLEVGTGFHGELTGRENIYLNGAILGMKRREVSRKLDEIIAFSEIEQHIDTPVKRYSSGMYVRLAFAVAAHLDSEILIADEVLAVGDASFQKKALGKMNDLSTGQGRTVLFVSHQIPAVRTLCNKGIFLEKGRIIPTQTLQDCVNLYLSNPESEGNQSFWSGIQGDENLQIMKTFISPTGLEKDSTNTYNKGDIIYLNIEYELLQTNSLFVFNVEFFNINGQQVCCNSAGDFFPMEDLLQFQATGTHSLQLQIDSSIFAEGTYHIKFDFSIHNIKRIITDTPTLAFEIVRAEANFQQNSTLRQNTIAPMWQWMGV